MRRRSERKKSTDASPAQVGQSASRRALSRRSRKSPTPSESEKNVVEQLERDEELAALHEANSGAEEEQTTRRSRSIRKRTPRVSGGGSSSSGGGASSPAKRKRQSTTSTDQMVVVVPEGENGAATNAEGEEGDHETEEIAFEAIDAEDSQESQKKVREEQVAENMEEETQSSIYEDQVAPSLSPAAAASPKTTNSDDSPKEASDVLEIQAEEQENEKQSVLEEESQQLDTEKPTETNDNTEEGELAAGKFSPKLGEENSPQEVTCKRNSDSTEVKAFTPPPLPPSTELVNCAPPADSARVTITQRKRKWITKRASESKAPILSISTDSLKNLIADVHPVPLSDVQLDSSSEVEVVSEREEGEQTPSPERIVRRRASSNAHLLIEKTVEKSSTTSKRNQSDGHIHAHDKHDTQDKQASTAASGGTTIITGPVQPVQRLPSPARNKSSNVLYITNLVRPFTVLQLKGLLARTGKIVEQDGFWIDRIKSKCYVQYETSDEAIETRHALHGVRWPVSNPKCLNVDFGLKADMVRAIQSTKEDGPKFGHDNHKDNLIVSGSSWSRDRNDVEEKKGSRPVREWDVGKKESLDRDKTKEKERHRSRERDVSMIRDRERDRENDKNRDRKNRSRGRDPRSSSLSPARKIKKKENDPPLRLLDDLFRKTKATPCIYWLPLTPEQIAEKEAFRQKRIEEHKQRIKQRELERGKDRERERTRSSRDRGSRDRGSRERRRY